MQGIPYLSAIRDGCPYWKIEPNTNRITSRDHVELLPKNDELLKHDYFVAKSGHITEADQVIFA
jgi:hypothetical protein